MSKKLRLISCVLALIMLISSVPAVPVPVFAQEEGTLSTDITNPFSSDVSFTVDGTSVTSNSYRIPAMVTLADGTIVAAADIRWNTTYDGGCLDTLVARSTDGGVTWQYSVANYLGDNGNEYNSQSTAFIDPSLTVAADGKTVYLLCDLYPYGIALNGNGSQKTPTTDIGFTEEGYLKLSNNEHASYDYYLKDGYIYDSSNTQVAGYAVDQHFNLYENDVKVSNLFFANSPYKVVRTGFLYLISSTNGGADWSAPTLLNLKTSSEQVCLVSPGNGITTSDGTMVFPVYSHNGTGNQQLGFVYSKDGAIWSRSTNFAGADWSSESAVVEIGKGTLRFFYRNGTSNLCYVDYDMNANAWGSYVNTGVKTNSNTQLSAITYSKTFNGNQVVLVSCPTGPNSEGSNNNDGKYRTNGKIFVGVVAADSTMSWPKSIDVGPYKATAQLQDPNYTEEQGFFAYSCLTERSDGSITILYENNQFDWGASGSNGDGTYDPDNVTTYYTITGKSYSRDNLGLLFDDEKVIDRTATIRDGVTSVTLYADPSDSSGAAIDVNTDILPEIMAISGMYYDDASGTLFYRVRAAVGFTWPEEYDSYFYISADSVDLRTDYGIAIPIVDFTNAAPIFSSASIPQPATYKLRSSARTFSLSKAASNTSGLVLDKKVTANADGTYTVNLEAYTTGTVTVQQTTKPMDIVLVLDQSGSMAWCIGCGSDEGHHTTYDVIPDGTYYYKERDWIYTTYKPLYYCSTCKGWHDSENHGGTTYQPKTSDSDKDGNHTQFYEECESSRYDALVAALDTFVDEVRTKSLNGGGDPVDHRIAIVGFSSDEFNNTELLTGVTISEGNAISDSNAKHYPDGKAHNGAQYPGITSAQYSAALQDMSTDEGYNSVTGAIDALTAHGGTETLDGIDMAYEILNNDTKKNEESREKVVILFTDGTTDSTRSKLLNKAYDIKSTFGATVYTVGIFSGANGSLSSYEDDITDDNSLMHLLSSNYPDAKYVSNGWSNRLVAGELNSSLSGDDSYYLSASDSAALNDIFQSMSSQIGSTSMDLGSETVVKDIVTPQFDLPAGVSSVVVKQVDCLTFDDSTGVATWGTGTALSSADTVRIDPSTNSVSVTGFDFKHNYVAENGRKEDDATTEGDFHGRKLVITFVITPDPDFLGGDNVETNGTASGVYDKDGTCVGTFVNPQVNVPLKDIDTVAQDKHIYYGNTTDLTGILNLHVKESTSGNYLQNIANGINNAYVDLVYTVTLNDQTVVTYTIPAGIMWDNGTWAKADGTVIDMSRVTIDSDTPYGILCTMVSKNNTDNQESANGNAKIYVYKPVLTFKDATKTPKEDSVAYNTDNYISTVWKNGDILSTAVTMEGAPPTLTLTYISDANCVDGSGLVVTYDDFYVNVTVKIGDTDITSAVTFEHQDCNPACSFGAGKGEFMIHVVKVLTSLTIQKQGWIGQEIDPNQTFIFEVTDSSGLKLTVTVHGNGSTTINGLKVGGSYTVTELTDWSWRYEFSEWKFVSNNADDTSGNENAASVTLGTDGNKIIFTNQREQDKWLDGDTYEDNHFNQK